MTAFSRRSLICCALLLFGLVPAGGVLAADNPKEIYVDWATYNPVSLLLKDKGLLEKEFAKDGIKVVWVKTVSSSSWPMSTPAMSATYGSRCRGACGRRLHRGAPPPSAC